MKQHSIDTVVIVGNGHYAVVVEYDNVVDNAPFVVASCYDLWFDDIKTEAKKEGVLVYEDKKLASALFWLALPNQVVPDFLYQQVAEALVAGKKYWEKSAQK